jgi:hypothetical protein
VLDFTYQVNYSTSDILIPSPKYIKDGMVHLKDELLRIWCTVSASSQVRNGFSGL